MPGSNGADIAADSDRTAKAARDTLKDVRDVLPDLARRAEQVFQDKAGAWKEQGREAASVAGEQLETARAYVIERVQERPFTTTFAVLGAGFLLGLLFAGRRK
jgi:ElaB/YqjD/DUF883 family membrane-anchored ribosome-binding protein